jgi:FixJ family two-component response regulator
VAQKPIIACVEDDVSGREALESLLKAFGFVPEVFSSAEQFLQSDRLDGTSCLITDVHWVEYREFNFNADWLSWARAFQSSSLRRFPTTGFVSGH